MVRRSPSAARMSRARDARSSATSARSRSSSPRRASICSASSYRPPGLGLSGDSPSPQPGRQGGQPLDHRDGSLLSHGPPAPYIVLTRRREDSCRKAGLKKRPASAGFLDGRYWARTSDPQLVDTAAAFAPVRLGSLIPAIGCFPLRAVRDERTRANGRCEHCEHGIIRRSRLPHASRPPSHGGGTGSNPVCASFARLVTRKSHGCVSQVCRKCHECASGADPGADLGTPAAAPAVRSYSPPSSSSRAAITQLA
jgi:hypothetical protein